VGRLSTRAKATPTSLTGCLAAGKAAGKKLRSSGFKQAGSTRREALSPTSEYIYLESAWPAQEWRYVHLTFASMLLRASASVIQLVAIEEGICGRESLPLPLSLLPTAVSRLRVFELPQRTTQLCVFRLASWHCRSHVPRCSGLLSDVEIEHEERYADVRGPAPADETGRGVPGMGILPTHTPFTPLGCGRLGC
jgi:hypothetical protein